jgi:hypothetical protein
MENSTVQLGSTIARLVAAQQRFQAHLAFWPIARNSGGKPWLLGGSAGWFRRARSPGPVGNGGRHDTGLEESRLEELGRSAAHRWSYLWFRASSSEERRWGARGGWSSRRRRSGKGVAGGGGSRWTGVRHSASAWCEEKQRRGVSGRQR